MRGQPWRMPAVGGTRSEKPSRLVPARRAGRAPDRRLRRPASASNSQRSLQKSAAALVNGYPQRHARTAIRSAGPRDPDHSAHDGGGQLRCSCLQVDNSVTLDIGRELDSSPIGPSVELLTRCGQVALPYHRSQPYPSADHNPVAHLRGSAPRARRAGPHGLSARQAARAGGPAAIASRREVLRSGRVEPLRESPRPSESCFPVGTTSGHEA